MADADPRLIPARPDLAALHLRDVVEAAAYASGQPMRASAPAAPVTATPDAEAEQTTQILFGETFMVYENEGGWVWGQSALDGYVGYAPEACFIEVPMDAPAPGWRVAAMQAIVYPEPSVKARPIGALPFGAQIDAEEAESGFAPLALGGYVPAPALRPATDHAKMWVQTAERFRGVPYLWGGRSPAGLDCSGLIQIALQAAGMKCPRDSDQQMASVGRPAPAQSLRRGDLVFWKGHVGVLTAPDRLLHANAHHMEVTEEPFEAARARIAAGEYGDVLEIRRITV